MQRFFAYALLDDGTGNGAPFALITVHTDGTQVLTDVYADEIGTVQSNPLVADVEGYFQFYAMPGVYDVVLSGGGIVTPYTWTGILLVDTRLSDWEP
jgi:hypothetical protein